MATALSVADFCHEHGISRSLFYKLLREGKGPRTFKLGQRTLISVPCAEEWRRALERQARS
jgi:hypothetical protein